MKKFSLLFLIFMLCVGCAFNINELREKGNHNVFYISDSLENVYNHAIKRYSECGIMVSNTFIDSNAGVAGVSFLFDHGWWVAHADMKVEQEHKVKIDVYSVNNRGQIGQFVKIMQYIAENKDGCP